MRISVLGGVVLLAACRRHSPDGVETCDPAGAARWAPADGRPKVQGPSPGCGKLGARGRRLQRTLTVDGQPRTYTAVAAWAVPPAEPAPLVFVFHGLGGSGERARRHGLESVIAGKAMLVYPDGLPVADFGGKTGWDLGRDGRDLAFFDRLLEALGDEVCIDRGRVFATGHSFGGWMTNRLGFARASRLRGIAPVAGGLNPRDCNGPPLPALIIHARNDRVVDFAEGQAARAMWSKAAGCRDGTHAMGAGPCVLHDGCTTPVGFCEHRQGHTFPDFGAAAIWSFFEGLR